MTLLTALDPVSSPWVPPNDGVSVVYKFVKRTTIPAVESIIGLCANIFGASDELDALQDNCLKNYHTIGVPLLSLYDAKNHCKDLDKKITNLTRRCVVALGWQTDKFFTYLATYHPL